MTIIVADTTCGLPRDLLKGRGIPFVPQVVISGGMSLIMTTANSIQPHS